MERHLNPAEVATGLLIERTLAKSTAYRKIDESLYTVKQGSTYVLVNIVPWGDNKALVRCVAQLVKGVRLEGSLAAQLLELNAHLRFGAFAYDPKGPLILFLHSILGGATLDPEELLATCRDVAVNADEYDDKIIQRYGGQTMKDLVEEAALERVLSADPNAFQFNGERR
jgi:hypothetical protein